MTSSLKQMKCRLMLHTKSRGNWPSGSEVKYFLTEAVQTSTRNLCFEERYEKNQNFLSENVHV